MGIDLGFEEAGYNNRAIFYEGQKSFEDAINLSLYFEAKTFLHGLFIVEDKLSMAHSLETRVPFMDNELVDFGTTIPPRYKLREIERILKIDENEPGKLKRYYEQTGDGKIILRKAMSKIIPEKISDQPSSMKSPV